MENGNLQIEKIGNGRTKTKGFGRAKKELGKLLQRQNYDSYPSEFAVIMPQRLSPEQAACYINMSTVWLQRSRSYSEEELRQREGCSYIPMLRYIRCTVPNA